MWKGSFKDTAGCFGAVGKPGRRQDPGACGRSAVPLEKARGCRAGQEARAQGPTLQPGGSGGIAARVSHCPRPLVGRCSGGFRGCPLAGGHREGQLRGAPGRGAQGSQPSPAAREEAGAAPGQQGAPAASPGPWVCHIPLASPSTGLPGVAGPVPGKPTRGRPREQRTT